VSPRRRPTNRRGRGGRSSSSRAVIALAVMGAVVALYGWNSMLLGPRNRARAAVQKELTTARQQEQDLRQNMARLRKLAADTKSREAELARLGRLVPPHADMAGAILALDEAAKQAQVSMASFVPSPPVAGAAGGPATVSVAMNIDGTFDQLVDYLSRLEGLDRLVVLDSLQLAAGGNGAPSGVGPPTLQAQLNARLFAATGPAVPAATIASGAAGTAEPSTTAVLSKAGG
jgi:Tfp pilus assembly protein PilO